MALVFIKTNSLELSQKYKNPQKVVYVCIGAAIFSHLEHDNETKTCKGAEPGVDTTFLSLFCQF